MSCNTCQPMPSCLEGLTRYSLQDPVYSFVINCPPGYDCQGARFVRNNPTDPTSPGHVSIICCDGNEYGTDVPADVTEAQYTAIVQSLVDNCARLWPFCQDPDNEPSGTVTNPRLPQAPPPVGPTPPETWYYSKARTVTLTCPGGGNTFTYTLPAGRFIAPSQLLADTFALAEANRQARIRRICLGPLGESFCAESAVAGTVKVVGPGTTFNWSVVSGSLPTGLVLADGWITGNGTAITGTATTPGTYTFTIRCRSSLGDYADRTYTVCVVGMTPATLSDGSIGVAYSETLTAPACAIGPLSWQVYAGTLPAGLSLNEETGEISGTPTTAGVSNFTIALQTEAT